VSALTAGTVVLPQGEAEEQIVGIVVHVYDRYAQVVWMSDRRGLFYCEEFVDDLTVASLFERDEITDTKLDHSLAALALSGVAIYATVK
jgi:hypothetical protein